MSFFIKITCMILDWKPVNKAELVLLSNLTSLKQLALDDRSHSKKKFQANENNLPQNSNI